MDALKKILLSDNIILSDYTLEKYRKIVNMACKLGPYKFTFSDYFEGDRRFVFVDEITKQIRKSCLDSIITQSSKTENYTLILAEALTQGYTDINEFLRGDPNNIELSVFLFLLKDGVLPSVTGFTTLKKRISKRLEVIYEQRKNKDNDFRIFSAFGDIRRYESPAKTRKTDFQHLRRAMIYSKLANIDKSLTPQSYVSLVAIMIYNNNSGTYEYNKIVKACNDFYNEFNIRSGVAQIRLTEIVVFAIQNPGCKYRDIQNYVKNIFCIGTTHVCRPWDYERRQPETKRIRRILKQKYGKDTEKAIIYEMIYRIKLSLGILEEEILENTMRGE